MQEEAGAKVKVTIRLTKEFVDSGKTETTEHSYYLEDEDVCHLQPLG